MAKHENVLNSNFELLHVSEIRQISVVQMLQIYVEAQHYEKYRNFTWFSGVEILRKGIVSAQFRANCPKLCGNCVFPQNFHTRKSGEITIQNIIVLAKSMIKFDKETNIFVRYNEEFVKRGLR